MLDLTLLIGSPSCCIQNWRTIETGLDHDAICFNLLSRSSYAPLDSSRISFNIAKADWDDFALNLEI